MLKFCVKFFYVMGKALSGELFCMRTGIVMLSGTYLYNAKVWDLLSGKRRF